MRLSLAAILTAAAFLQGCAAVALTAAAVGGGALANHQMGGMAYKTFTEPLPKVREATNTAFRRMAIKPEKTEKTDLGERLLARAGDRSIEVELEALTPNATRMKAVARRDGGLVVDAATALEIINQAEKALPAR
jgi:hypothetical protein